MAVIVTRTGDERIESVFAPVSRFTLSQRGCMKKIARVDVIVILTSLFKSFYYNFFAFTNFTRSATLVSRSIFIDLRERKMKSGGKKQ